MNKDKFREQTIFIILIAVILILPLVDLYIVFSQPKVNPTPSISSNSPILNTAVYQNVWDKASKRKIFGVSPSAELNFSTLPYGRTDPFHR